VLAGEPRWDAVLHLAGVLDDALLANLSEAQIERVLRPKLAGARNLDQLTAGWPLRAFVLFSSIAGVLGGLGQSAYAAANCYLDGLAHARRLRGEVATSIAWGLWRSGAGMAAGLSEAALDRLRAEGVGALDPGDACRLLDRALASPEPVVVAARFVRAALQRKADRGGAVPPLLHGLLARPPGHAGPSPRPAWRRELLRAGGPEEQLAAIRKRVLAEAAAVFGAASLPARDAERPLRELGLTSLMALQLRDRLAAAAGVELAATLAFDHPTCASIADHLRDALGLTAEAAAAAAATAADHLTSLEIDAELDAVLGPAPSDHPPSAAARAVPEEHRS
jgi:hypothetical protein